MVTVGLAIAMSVSYVIPNAQAVQAASPATPGLQQAALQVSGPVAGTIAAAAVTRDSYGVTLPPPPPPPPKRSFVAAEKRVPLNLSPSTAALQWPVPADTRIASAFGPRSCSGCSSDHQGVDLSAPGGSPVLAMADGIVIETNAPGYAALGTHVRIQHLIDGQVVTTVYAHMQAGSMPFSVGDSVAAGQVVGAVGCTGACTGNHLHFEIRPGGFAPVDPKGWLTAKIG